METRTEPRRIVRLLSTDLNGDLKVAKALRKIKGISFMFSKNVCGLAGIDMNKKIGYMNEEELKRLEEAIKNPEKFGMPKWMLNRRRDLEGGSDAHFIGAQLDFKKHEDITRLRKLRAYRGIRHELGLPVRGQRTRTSFRHHKAVGVKRKVARPEKKEAPKK